MGSDRGRRRARGAQFGVGPDGDGGDAGVVQRRGDLAGRLEEVDRLLEGRVGALDAANDGDGARGLLYGALKGARRLQLLEWSCGFGFGVRGG